VAVWLGEKKGAPASVRLYPFSQLLGSVGNPEKTEHRDLPTALARKAFYKADKLSVKWNNSGTMVSERDWAYSTPRGGLVLI
jgi:translation initiation factor 2A